MNALITSFFKSHQLPPGTVIFSAAVYQPIGYHYEKIPWTDIRDGSGVWIRPRNFIMEDDPLAAYHHALLDLYASREHDITQWLAWRANALDTFALCCWCPSDKAAQRQLVEHGSFVCHTAVIGEVLEAHGVRVWYDEDRRRMKVLP